jgi:O-antigen ligase
MALHLATMIPIAVALMLNSRGPLKKALYAGCSLLMLAGTFVTYSRGAFLGLIGASAVMVWKLAKRNRLLVFGLVIGSIVVAMALMPGGYGNRLLSIFDYSRDPVGSAPARQALLIRSFWVALRHPLLGIGMGNFPIVSIAGQVSHNSYTQVASELGLPALIVYVSMIITSLRRLARVERDSFEVKEDARFYYLSVGLQASLVCYMISSFFLSVAYVWNIYYLIGYALCLHRTFETRPAAKKAIKVTNQQEESTSQEEPPAVKVEPSDYAGATNGRRVLAPLAREGFDVAK